MKWGEISSIIHTILRTAFPVAISGLIFSVATLFNMHLLGSVNEDNLYLLAAFSPIYYLLIALQESLRATAITLSSKKTANRTDAEMVTNFLYIVVIVNFIFIIMLYFSAGFMADKLHIILCQQNNFISLCHNMAALNLIMCCNAVINAMILGFGYPGLALQFNISACLGNVILVIVFCKYFLLNLDGFFYAIDISYGAVCLIMLRFLKANNYRASRVGVFSYRQCVALLSGIRYVGMPVFFSYLIVFGMLFVFNSILSRYGTSVVAGYGLAYRMQVLIILPAIALGSALAVLVNRQLMAKYKVLLIGLVLALCFYFMLSLIIYEYRDPLSNWITKNLLIRQSVLSYLEYVAPSYFVLGPVLVFITFLEQIGYGVQAFFYNLIYFACVGLVSWQIVASHGGYILFYKMISLANILPLVFILIFIPTLIKKLN